MSSRALLVNPYLNPAACPTARKDELTCGRAWVNPRPLERLDHCSCRREARLTISWIHWHCEPGVIRVVTGMVKTV